MGLITSAQMINVTDRVAAYYRQAKDYIGPASGSAPAASSRFIAETLLADILDLDDYDVVKALTDQAKLSADKANAKRVIVDAYGQFLTELDSHVGSKGKDVATTIKDLNTFQAYYNGGLGGAAFSAMLTPEFSDAYFDAKNKRLSPAGVMSPAIHPWLLSSATNGLGTRAVGGSFTDGVAVDTTKHSAVRLIAEVTTNFANGATAPSVSVAGTDNTGVSMTWTGTLTGNNPASAVSTTITPAVDANERQVVAVGSATGISVGSVLKVNAGLIDEEVVVVEALSGTDVTAVFRKAHLAGAAVTGFNSLLLTPGTVGRRCVNVTGITITVGTHDAGALRIVGVQDRVAI